MGCPKYQFLSLLLVCIAAGFTLIALFVMTEGNDVNWYKCSLHGRDQYGSRLDVQINVGVTHQIWKADYQGHGHADITWSNCDSTITEIEGSGACDAGRTMSGLGITSMVTGGIGILSAFGSLCMGYRARVMLLASVNWILSAMFLGIGGGIAHRDMQTTLPTGTDTQGNSISCDPGAGPLAMTFIACIFYALAALLFLPLKPCLPKRGEDEVRAAPPAVMMSPVPSAGASSNSWSLNAPVGAPASPSYATPVSIYAAPPPSHVSAAAVSTSPWPRASPPSPPPPPPPPPPFARYVYSVDSAAQVPVVDAFPVSHPTDAVAAAHARAASGQGQQGGLSRAEMLRQHANPFGCPEEETHNPFE